MSRVNLSLDKNSALPGHPQYPTLESARDDGERLEATLNLDRLDGAVPVPDVPLVMRLKCSKCGAAADHIFARPNWAERKIGPVGLGAE